MVNEYVSTRSALDTSSEMNTGDAIKEMGPIAYSDRVKNFRGGS